MLQGGGELSGLKQAHGPGKPVFQFRALSREVPQFALMVQGKFEARDFLELPGLAVLPQQQHGDQDEQEEGGHDQHGFQDLENEKARLFLQGDPHFLVAQGLVDLQAEKAFPALKKVLFETVALGFLDRPLQVRLDQVSKFMVLHVPSSY